MEERFLRIARKEWLYAKIDESTKREVFDEDGINVATRISQKEIDDLAMDIIAWGVPVSEEEFNKIKNKTSHNNG